MPLHSVLVHSGGVHGGHYYAYVRPNGKDWLRFDDDRVERADTHRAVDDNWGGDDEKAPPGGGLGNPNPPPLRLGKYANAYMLVYLRESEWDSVMCEVTVDDISEHVRARLKVEAEEKERKRREKAEAHLFTLVRIATDEDLRAQIGASRFFDLVDFERVGLTLKLPKKAPFADVQRMVAERLGVAPEAQRYWVWSERQNKTYRPAAVLDVEGPEQSIAGAGPARNSGGRTTHKPGEMVKLNLFLETPPPATNQFLPAGKTSTLLFFKHFIPGAAATAPRLEYAGRGIFPNSTKIADMFPLLAKKGGLPEGCPIDAFEEVKPEPTVMVERLGKACTLVSAQLEHGDILVFQRLLPPHEAKALQYPAADEFLRHVRNRAAVSFRPLCGGEEGAVSLDLLKDMRYDAVSAALAKALGLDHPLKVRLTAQGPFSRLPRSAPLKYGAEWTLEEMLRGSTTAVAQQVRRAAAPHRHSPARLPILA
jgi:ubiquitin carboxyl-terminal hydrolase 7